MSKEALRTQIDALQVDNQRLQAENARLRDDHKDSSARLDAEAEVLRLTELVRKLEEEAAQANSTTDAVEARIQELVEAAEGHREEIAQLRDDLERSETERRQLVEEQDKFLQKIDSLNAEKELECFRAVETERQKWEAREDRLLRQIAELEAENRHSGTSENAPQNQETVAPGERTPRRTENLLGELGTVNEHDTEISVGVGIEPHPQLEGPIYSPSPYIPHHLPPLAPYKGEMTPDAETTYKGEMTPDAETIDEWLERFSMLAEECRWTPRAKLLHLTSRLEKQAYAFYRSCIPQIKESYDRLAAELHKRFTPIRIQGVDTSLFHERKQKPGESVDQYAQELQRLHQKAYPESLRGSEDAEQIGKTLLASQFLTGLRPEIKKNVTGSEQFGEIDKLLAKARFEEAKLLELSSNEPRPTPTGDNKQGKSFVPHPPKLNHPQGPWLQRPPPSVPRSPMICYNCGGKGHPARYCRWRNSKENESKGKNPKFTGTNRMSAIHADQGSDCSGKKPSEYIAELRQELQRVEVEEALSESKSRLYGITSTTTDEETPLGPSSRHRLRWKVT